MRRIFVLMMLLVMVAGCGAGPAPAPPVAPAEIAAEPVAPPPPPPVAATPPTGTVEPPPPWSLPGDPLPPELSLLTLSDPTTLTADALQERLTEYLNVGEPAPDFRLRDLIDTWYSQWKPPVLHADLDSDGQQEYVVDFRLGGSGRPINGSGALYIVWRKDGRLAVDRSPGDEVPGVFLYDLADLTGDGRPEIIWGSTMAGAHTAHYEVYVSDWAPGRLEQLPGKIGMATMTLTREGTDLVLNGGLIGSVGAGPQRAWTDRYRWVDGQFRLTDRRYEAGADWGYWRLVDGVTYERFGQLAEAEQAYREAMDPARQAADPTALKPEQADRFAAAVRTWAQVRLATLLMKAGRTAEVDRLLTADGPFADVMAAWSLSSSTDGACPQAARGAAASGMIGALNGLYGYANEIWTWDNLCGLVP